MKPTLEEYEEMGREMCLIRSRLIDLTIRLGVCTGVSKAPYKHAREALQSLDTCKSESEELMFSHYPELGKEYVKVFYREVPK